MIATYIILLIISVMAFIALTAFLLPFLLLRTKHTVSSSKDRGLSRFRQSDGYGVVYLPEVGIRDKVKKYAILEKEEGKYFICKLADGITYVDYDVIAFDEEGKVINSVWVKEIVEEGGYTNRTELPKNTSYASLKLNETNLGKEQNKYKAYVPKYRIILYLLLSALLAVGEALMVKLCCSYIFGGVFRESFMLWEKSWLVTVVVMAGLFVLDIILNIIVISLKLRKGKS